MIRLLTGLLIFTVLCSAKCSQETILKETDDFSITGAYAQAWEGGEETAGSGINLYLPYESENGVKPDSVYFRGYKAALYNRLKEGKSEYQAVFTTGKPAEKLSPMYENVAPNQAVVIYTVNNTKKYFLVKNITERDKIHMP